MRKEGMVDSVKGEKGERKGWWIGKWGKRREEGMVDWVKGERKGRVKLVISWLY